MINKSNFRHENHHKKSYSEREDISRRTNFVEAVNSTSITVRNYVYGTFWVKPIRGIILLRVGVIAIKYSKWWLFLINWFLYIQISLSSWRHVIQSSGSKFEDKAHISEVLRKILANDTLPSIERRNGTRLISTRKRILVLEKWRATLWLQKYNFTLYLLELILWQLIFHLK